MLKYNMHRAQNRMKQLADRRRSERSFEVGKWVYLKLQPYRQISVANRPSQKLGAKYFGPYLVIKKVGAVAYTLQLPPSSKIHPTFHVSLLKRNFGPPPEVMDNTLPITYDTQSIAEIKVPSRVVEVRSVKKKNVAKIHCLIEWKNTHVEEGTWKSAVSIMKKFPAFDPWGQGSLDGGSIDTITSMGPHESTDGGTSQLVGQETGRGTKLN
ncbi:uncharacterized protein LOC141706867 [Apium graveolens]|uniref:uncharacterized protein LOC141706867 n=1 Tax=Apium graveolens TaxID=4045 RepID=UPI003D7A3028